jgi:hypothetical protein
LKLLSADYASPSQAAGAYQAYVALLNGSKQPDTEEASANGSLFKVNGAYLFCQLRGPRLIVVSGARHRTSPTALARSVL